MLTKLPRTLAERRVQNDKREVNEWQVHREKSKLFRISVNAIGSIRWMFKESDRCGVMKKWVSRIWSKFCIKVAWIDIEIHFGDFQECLGG